MPTIPLRPRRPLLIALLFFLFFFFYSDPTALSFSNVSPPPPLSRRQRRALATTTTTKLLLASKPASARAAAAAAAPRVSEISPAVTTIATNDDDDVADKTKKERRANDVDDDRRYVYRKDYRAPPYKISRVSINFNLGIGPRNVTRVTSQLTIVRNEHDPLDGDEADEAANRDLILDGDSTRITLVSLKLDGRALMEGRDYDVLADNLVVKASCLSSPVDGTQHTLQTIVDLNPFNSPSQELSGLYHRDGMYCTHCEPSAFRQITYFVDRPDNTAIFENVRIEADKKEYPVLLSNGHLVEMGDVEVDGCADVEGVDGDLASTDGDRKERGGRAEDKDARGCSDAEEREDKSKRSKRHYAIYTDPHPKPSYLFALLAAGPNLKCIRDTHTTRLTNRTIQLELYGDETQLPKLTFAMSTLKKAMAWDETRFGLEYDLDVYRIVAADHFHFGAMENKGLNLFLTSLIATDPDCTTDVTYDLVEKTIGHEYFHNWSGNRVTVQNWFEFTLKEGLTVYRDQEFTSDVGLQTAVRIEAVKILREKQFAEDASPETSHPIRPDRCRVVPGGPQHDLDSLASSTTYHKGAEVFRMYETVLSREGFQKGFALYAKRHDGRGATCDDFHDAMVDANSETSAVDLTQFHRWYGTPGTPTVTYGYTYNASHQKLELRFTQSNDRTAHVQEQEKVLLHIPIAVGLLDKVTGKEVVPTTVLHLKEKMQSFTFDGLANEVVPSILRGFSAPVRLVPESAEEEDDAIDGEETLAFLATYDTDGFNKWEAMQKLFTMYILGELKGNDTGAMKRHTLEAFGRTLNDSTLDPSSKSYLLKLPTESVLARQLDVVDPVKLHFARNGVKRMIARQFQKDLLQKYHELSSEMDHLESSGIAKTDTVLRASRSLRNVLLEYLCGLDETSDEQETAAKLAVTHFDNAECFTDKLVAFRQLSSMTGAATQARDDVTLKFYQFAKATGDFVVMNKWFQTQALSNLPDALNRVKALTQHPDFRATNAGRFRALITSFTLNSRAFHCDSGEGYAFIGDVARQMDRVAPQLAVELASKLAPWRKDDATRAALMQKELRRIGSMKPISKSLAAVVKRALPPTAETKAASLSRSDSKEEGSKKKMKKNQKKSTKGKSKSRGFS